MDLHMSGSDVAEFAYFNKPWYHKKPKLSLMSHALLSHFTLQARAVGTSVCGLLTEASTLICLFPHTKKPWLDREEIIQSVQLDITIRKPRTEDPECP